MTIIIIKRKGKWKAVNLQVGLVVGLQLVALHPQQLAISYMKQPREKSQTGM